jgi:hypothetical protein
MNSAETQAARKGTLCGGEHSGQRESPPEAASDRLTQLCKCCELSDLLLMLWDIKQTFGHPMLGPESSSSQMAATPADTVTLHGSANNSGDLMPPKPHTDAAVDRAREEFNALERSLTSHSRKSVKKSASNDSSDVEKAPAEDEDEERFDLREYLTSSNDANQGAGIKHKVR